VGGADGSNIYSFKTTLKMSEYNSLKELYRTAQTTDDLDLFLYTGLPIVGRDGLVSIIADVTFDRLVQTCKKQRELAVEMLEPSVLMGKIKQMKSEFYKAILSEYSQLPNEVDVEWVGHIYAPYFYTGDWQLRAGYSSASFRISGEFVRRLCDFDGVDFTKFQMYKIAQFSVKTFVFADSEQPELLQHTLDFINSN
jgi:hypothetical protein